MESRGTSKELLLLGYLLINDNNNDDAGIHSNQKCSACGTHKLGAQKKVIEKPMCG